jgi:hypothetical protein
MRTYLHGIAHFLLLPPASQARTDLRYRPRLEPLCPRDLPSVLGLEATLTAPISETELTASFQSGSDVAAVRGVEATGIGEVNLIVDVGASLPVGTDLCGVPGNATLSAALQTSATLADEMELTAMLQVGITPPTEISPTEMIQSHSSVILIADVEDPLPAGTDPSEVTGDALLSGVVQADVTLAGEVELTAILQVTASTTEPTSPINDPLMTINAALITAFTPPTETSSTVAIQSQVSVITAPENTAGFSVDSSILQTIPLPLPGYARWPGGSAPVWGLIPSGLDQNRETYTGSWEAWFPEGWWLDEEEADYLQMSGGEQTQEGDELQPAASAMAWDQEADSAEGASALHAKSEEAGEPAAEEGATPDQVPKPIPAEDLPEPDENMIRPHPGITAPAETVPIAGDEAEPSVDVPGEDKEDETSAIRSQAMLGLSALAILGGALLARRPVSERDTAQELAGGRTVED